MFLNPVSGPACTRCGCKDTTVLTEPHTASSPGREPWTTPGNARCKHCGERFTFEPDGPARASFDKPHKELVVIAKTVCPDCRSDHVKVKSSPKPKSGRNKVRYYKCEACGRSFKDSESVSVLLPQ